MNGLQEEQGRFQGAPAPGAVQTGGQEGAPTTQQGKRRLAATVEACQFFNDLIKMILGSAALLLVVPFLYVVGRDVWNQDIVVDKIDVPQELEGLGLRPEVLSSRLIDEIGLVTMLAAYRGERQTVAGGWKTADFVVPVIGLTTSSIVRVMEDVVGRPDRQVSGEIIRSPDGGPVQYRLRFRLSPAPKGWKPVDVAIPAPGGARTAEELDRALRTAAEDLLREIDPLSLAAYYFAQEVQKIPPEEKGRHDETLRQFRGKIVDAVTECLERCDQTDRGRAYNLWGELLRKVAALTRNGTEAKALLRDAAEKYALAVGAGYAEGIVYTGWADALLDAGDIDGGLAKYAMAAQQNPNDPFVFYNWGNSLLRQGNLPAAADKLQMAERLDPSRPWTYYQLGLVLQRQGRHEEAITMFEQTIQRDGRNHCALEEWGRSLEALGRQEEAQQRRQQAQALRADLKTLLNLSEEPKHCA
jgi:tetratricopeptide (TPR) repeat protein